GFSGCAAINLGDTFGLQISLFFFLCYAALLTLGRDSGRWLNFAAGQIVPMVLTILFGAAVLLSLYLSILDRELLPINISVSTFIAVGLCVTWLTVAYLHSERRIFEILTIEFASVAFIGSWSALQLLCSLLGLPYPDFIFNNSASHFAQLYGVESEA